MDISDHNASLAGLVSEEAEALYARLIAAGSLRIGPGWRSSASTVASPLASRPPSAAGCRASAMWEFGSPPSRRGVQ
jgi:hypothetical protein